MRAILWYNRKHLQRTIGLIGFGFLLGVAGSLFVSAERIHRLTSENAALSVQVRELESELARQEVNLKDRQRVIVRRIRVEANVKPELLRIDVEKAVTAWLQPVLGKESKEVDPMLVSQIVEGRDYQFAGEQYRLRVTASHLVNETLTLIVRMVENPTKSLPGVP